MIRGTTIILPDKKASDGANASSDINQGIKNSAGPQAKVMSAAFL